MSRSSPLSAAILLLASALGVWAFLQPFTAAPPPAGDAATAAQARAEQAPLVFLVLAAVCLLVIVAGLEARPVPTHTLALLGVLVAVNAVLRLVSGPGGASAFFFLPLLAGFVFGAELGFLLGALSLLTSALLTGGVGPWLPFQMLAAGWGGMLGGLLPRLGGRLRLESAMLAAAGVVSAILFGVVMNLWFWPYLDPGAGAVEASAAWTPELGLRQSLARYAAFYLATSLWWDLARAGGNVILILLLGPAVLKLLDRFRRRFEVEWAE